MAVQIGEASSSGPAVSDSEQKMPEEDIPEQDRPEASPEAEQSCSYDAVPSQDLAAETIPCIYAFNQGTFAFHDLLHECPVQVCSIHASQPKHHT